MKRTKTYLIVALLFIGAVGLGRFVQTSALSAAVMAQSDPLRVNALFANFDINSTTFVFCDTGSPPAGIACSTGSAVGDGWFAVPSEFDKAIQVDVEALTATSVEFILEARLSGETAAAQIWPATGNRSATATGSFIVQVPDAIYQLRMGVKVTVDTVGAEDIDVVMNTFAPDPR